MEKISIMCKDIEQYALSQVENVQNKSSLSKAHIALMPDCHPGHYVPIGFSAIINRDDLERLPAAVVGNDIGCGVSGMFIDKPRRGFPFEKIDNIIKEECIDPKDNDDYQNSIIELLYSLKCRDHIDLGRAISSFGTLGGGNHFIEIDKKDDSYLLVVHSGSRYLGTDVCYYYSHLAKKNTDDDTAFIDCCLEGDDLYDYIHDVIIVTQFASRSREAILNTIIQGIKTRRENSYIGHYDIPHNYIDHIKDSYIIRKGAIALFPSVIIPINSRDGIIVGNTNNDMEDPKKYSLPHGAGRVLKRSDVASNYTVSTYKKEMKGIYSSAVSKDTLEECPMAYRDTNTIIDQIDHQFKSIEIYKPIYNFKNNSKG